MYPHQVLMEKNNLEKKDLTQEAQNYLKDFNHMLRGISLKEARAEKKGDEYIPTESDINKLNRFSKSVCVQIYEDMNTTHIKAKQEEINKKKLAQEALELKRIQEEEDEKRLEENQRIKEQEESNKKQQLDEQAKQEEEDNKGLFDYFF